MAVLGTKFGASTMTGRFFFKLEAEVQAKEEIGLKFGSGMQ